MTKLLKSIEPGKYISPKEALKQIEKMPDAPETHKVPKPNNPKISLEGKLTDLDYEPADNGQSKTQKQWIDYFNQNNKIMVSMPDFYRAMKTASNKILESLKNDFKKTYVMTSTKILYNQNDLDVGIIHYYGSNIVEPIKFRVLVPDYSNGPFVHDILNTREGLKFFHNLFMTMDSAEEMKKTLCDFYAENSRIWTPERHKRGYPAGRAVGFNRSIHPYLTNMGKMDTGRSRGITIKDAK